MVIYTKIKSEAKIMKREMLMKSIIEKATIQISIRDAKSMCFCISYQPIVSKVVKKLRKF